MKLLWRPSVERKRKREGAGKLYKIRKHTVVAKRPSVSRLIGRPTKFEEEGFRVSISKTENGKSIACPYMLCLGSPPYV